MEQKKFDPEKISIVEYKLLKGQVEEPEDFSLENAIGHDYETQVDLAFNLEEKLVRAELSVEIKTKSKKKVKTEAKGNFHFVFIFHVENMDELTKTMKNKKLYIDHDMGVAISTITYSTSRGILITRLQGTALRNFILPIINPNKLLPPIKEEKAVLQ